MWIWTANKFVKFHTRRLKWSENIPNSLRGLLFLKHPARVKVMSYQASGPVYFGPPWLMQSDTDPHQHADKRPRAGRNGQWCTQDDGPVAYTGPVGQWRIQDEHKPYECKRGGVRLTTLAPHYPTRQPSLRNWFNQGRQSTWDIINAVTVVECRLRRLTWCAWHRRHRRHPSLTCWPTASCTHRRTTLTRRRRRRPTRRVRRTTTINHWNSRHTRASSRQPAAPPPRCQHSPAPRQRLNRSSHWPPARCAGLDTATISVLPVMSSSRPTATPTFSCKLVRSTRRVPCTCKVPSDFHSLISSIWTVSCLPQSDNVVDRCMVISVIIRSSPCVRRPLVDWRSYARNSTTLRWLLDRERNFH